MATISDKLPWFSSLRWKLAISYVLLSLVPLIIFNLTIMAFIENYYLEERTHELRIHGVLMSEIVAAHGLDNLEQAAVLGRLRMQVATHTAEWGVRILVVDDSVRVIEDSNWVTPFSHVGQVILRQEVISALNGQDYTTLDRTNYVLHVAVSVSDPASGRVGAVLLITSVEDIFTSVAAIRNMLFLYSVAVGMLIIVLVVITANRLIHPLRNVMRVVQRMSTGQLNLRIPVKGKDEHAILSKAFNNMADKLEREEKTREEFVSNVSHELKTPLSAIKVLADSISHQESVPEEYYKEFLQDISSEVDRMTSIVSDLLTLVKVDQRENALNISRTNLNSVLEGILKRLSPLAEKKRVALIYEEVRKIWADFDEIKIAIALSNIVENGIKYTPQGGAVKVVIDADHYNAIITVKDTGIGIPFEEHEKIFNRFYRVDKTRDRDTGGTGLGLSISRSTVLLHGGTIRVASEVNEGALFTVKLPLRR